MSGLFLPRLTLAAILLVAAGACHDSLPTALTESRDGGPSATALSFADALSTAVTVPSPLVTVDAAGTSLEFWPYTGADLQGSQRDPMNLLFPGVDVRSVRTALMLLDGDRTGFGPLAVFDCTWKDAMGAHQTAYGGGARWEGSAVQLECGDYGPVRFHLRLFQLGDWTVGGAHFEVQIPGTNEHEVLSWEVAEALVAADVIRAGVLAEAPSLTQAITDAPTYRSINPLVYNGLPLALKDLTGGPLEPVAEPVPLGNDGRATVLAFTGPVEGQRAVSRREFVLEFDQVIPKPFCVQGPGEYLAVQGPIRFSQQVVEARNGNLRSKFQARGRLSLTPVNPLTGKPVGEPMEAQVLEQHRSVVTDHVTLTSSLQMQMILPISDAGGGRLMATLEVGPGSSDHGRVALSCGG